MKSTIRDEVARGRALAPQQITDGLTRLGVLRRRVVDFFGRYDLLLAPVTQIGPFPAEWEYPAEIDGVELGSYTAWMASCFRVTVLGAPALSLPCGFDGAGRPVGLQLIGRPGGDVDVLRAAYALEAALPGARRGPDLVALAAAGPAGLGPAAPHGGHEAAP